MTVKQRQIVFGSLILAIVFEAITCLLRFGLNLQSSHESAFMARFTLGLRIHHSYLGVLALIVAVLMKACWCREALIVLGIALMASDLVHHFLVLWPVVGSPQFDFFYKT